MYRRFQGFAHAVLMVVAVTAMYLRLLFEEEKSFILGRMVRLQLEEIKSIR
jgi:hypothetical protein